MRRQMWKYFLYLYFNSFKAELQEEAVKEGASDHGEPLHKWYGSCRMIFIAR